MLNHLSNTQLSLQQNRSQETAKWICEQSAVLQIAATIGKKRALLLA